MIIIRLAIALGLVCAMVDFYATVMGNKTSLHRAAHLAFAFVFLLLVYMIWMVR